VFSLVLKTTYPIDSVISYNSLSKDHLNYTIAITANHETQSYIESSKKVNGLML